MASIDRIRKKRERIEEEKRTGKKTSSITTSMDNIQTYRSDLKNGGIKYNTQNDFAPLRSVINSQNEAPVKTTKKDNEKKWYQKIVQAPSIFDDNEGFWDNALDVGQSIVGSTADVASKIIKAPARIGEGLGDAVGYIGAGVLDAFGKDEKADKIRKKATRNLTDEWFSGIDEWTDKTSVFGDTTDAVAEGIGYAATLYATGGLASAGGLGAVGTTAVTSGLTAASGFGSGTSQAYQSGATDEEAYTYGAIAGIAEAATELMFGGIAKGSKALGISKGAIPIDDMLAKKTTEKMTNQLVKNFTQYGIKAGAEGFEEVASGFLQALGKKATYMSEEELGKIIEDEELFEQFVVGAVTSGITQAPGLISSNKAGVDFVQTETETQKNISKQIQDLESQLDTSMSADQQKQVLDQIEVLKGQYNAETQSIAKQEQAERELRRTNFTYDTNKVTDETEKSVYDSATKYFNNTTRSHEFVERVAKISKDKGTRYSFINNEELKANGLNVEGKQVNGLVRTEQDGKPTILINIDSPKALNTIVGHETTHLLEGTQEYEELKQTIFEYAKTKGELDTRKNDLTKLYEGVNTDIDSELTADLVGDYLFTDSKFIDSLAVEKPTLFQKIKELIDDLVVRFKGTKEEKQLREVQKAFKAAYKQDTQYEGKKTIEGLNENQLKIINGEIDVYHGTDADITEMTSSKGKGMNFFSTNPKISKTYSKKGNVNSNRIKITNPLVVEGNGAYYNQIDFQGGKYKTEQIANWAKSNGYDGVIFKDIIDQGGKNLSGIKHGESRVSDVYVTFDSNQSQVVEKGIKFSLTDNQGRELSKEQQEFFKDSKVRDDKGNLLTVYHGTPYGGFTEFNSSHMGSQDGGGYLGDGYYFASEKAYAEDFTDEGYMDEYTKAHAEPGEYGNPQVYETYINIKNPYIVPENIDYDSDTLSNALGTNTNYEATNLLKEQGYDGIIYNFKSGEKEYLVFNSNQIKNIDNTNPTSNADIRYSLSEKGTLQDSEGNEVKLETTNAGTTGTLLAVHSVNEKNLKNILSLGGIPVGSLAITNANKVDVLSEFGGKDDFILMFKSDTIDPKNKLNEVYNRDVYSKTVPQIYQKVDKRALKKVIDEFYPYESEYGSLNKHDYSKSSLESIVDDLSYSSAVKAKFLEDNGYGIKKVYKDFRSGYYSFTAQEIENFKTKYPDLATLDEYSVDNSIAAQIKEITLDMMAESDPEVSREQFAKLFDRDFYLNDVIKFYRDIKQYDRANKGQEFDSYATRDNIDKAVKEHEEEFKQWLTSKFENLYGDKYFENESGTRKYDYTLENLTSYMKKGKTTAQQKGMFNSFSIGQAKAGAATRYKTLDQIREASKDLVDAETYKARHEAFEEIDDPVRTELGDTRISKGEDLFEVYSDYYMALSKAASGTNPTTALESNYFKDLTPEQINKFSEVAKELANLPAKYFEAKPQRAIGLNEIDTIAIPNTASESIKQQLINNGFNIVEYDPSIEGDKQRVVEEQDRLKFSLSQQGEDIAPIGDYNVYGKDIKLEVEEAIAPLQEEIKDLKQTIANVGKPTTYADLDELHKQFSEDFKTNNEAPMEMEDTTPDYDYEIPKVESPLYDRDIEEVSDRKIKAYQYEHPEVKPYFKEAAQGMLYDLNNTIKGERLYNDQVYYDTNGESGWTGIKRQTTNDIADLLDNFNYSYAEIRKGLEAIIKDNGAENIAVAKRIEFALDERLRNGYTAVDGLKIPANQEYIDLLREKEFSDYYNSIPSEDIAPLETNLEENSVIAPEINNIAENVSETAYEAITPKSTNEPKMIRVKDDLGYIPKNPTKESSYDTPGDKVAANKSTRPIKSTKGSTWNTLKYLFTNKNEAIDRYAKATGNNNIKYLADHINNIQGEIATNINNAQIDNEGNVIGKGIVDIFNQAREAKLEAAFDDYLFHLSNKARHKQGKGSLVPLTESEVLVAEYEKAYPEMKGWAKEVNQYNRNTLYKQVQAGLYTKEFVDGLTKKYEFYVPFYEDVERMYVPGEKGAIKTRGTVRLAEGGANRNLLNFEEAMARQTDTAIRAIRKNLLYREIVNSSYNKTMLMNGEDTTGLYADANGYYVTAKEGGYNIAANIGEDLYRGLDNQLEQQIRDYEKKLSAITKPLQKLSDIKRKIHTTWSPTFIVKNPLKDIQDAPLNSKYAKDWAINYPKALQELTTGKGENLQQFLNMYGEAGVMGDYIVDSGLHDITKSVKVKKKLKGVAKLNEIMELAPRYAEYMASLKNGTSQMEALYNAREVTTNFGRGGVITKALNRNGFTFLNASVQGFSKLIRNFSGENGAKGVVNASLKAVMYGVLPSLFNAITYDDDEEYEALPDYIKDNYYLFKTDEGEFIRIPKGRMISIFGSAARRALEYSNGDKDAFDGYLTNAYSQVGVSNPLENNILAPIIQAYGSENGKTWYGSDLVPTRLQDVPEAEQYDESTDVFSKWLGETFGISPYKVNYIFDQYSGGIGDLFLPLITPEANSDGSFLAPIKDQFTANSTMDNKYAGEFYTKRDELEIKSNSMYATEEDQLMYEYMNQVSWDMSSLYKEKREVQNSDLTKAEKYERVKEIQDQINEMAKNALETYNTGTYMDNYTSIGDYEFYKEYEDNEAEWRTVYDYKAEDLAKLGMTDAEKNEYFGLKQEFNNINDEYYKNKDGLESKYNKYSDEFEDESDELYMEKKNKIIEGIMNSNLTDEAKAYLYKEYYNSSAIDTITMSDIPVDYILDYQKNTFKADYDSEGKAIRNSRKDKVIDYVNEYDLGIAEKAIIIKSTNTFKFNDYNNEIVDYVANLNISEEDKIYILEELGMTVDEEGYAWWND